MYPDGPIATSMAVEPGSYAGLPPEKWSPLRYGFEPYSSLGYQPPAPEVVTWPTEPSGSGPLAHPAIVTRPTMH